MWIKSFQAFQKSLRKLTRVYVQDIIMVIFKHNLYKSTLSFKDYKLFILLTGTKQACQINWCSKVKNLGQWPDFQVKHTGNPRTPSSYWLNTFLRTDFVFHGISSFSVHDFQRFDQLYATVINLFQVLTIQWFFSSKNDLPLN